MSAGGDEPFARDLAVRDVLRGLSQPRKALPGKYLWDEAGSALFDRICGTEDYYLTRRETALLAEAAPAVAGTIGPHASLIEYGSGASRKARTLLDAMDSPKRYVAIDISARYLDAAVHRISADYPDLDVHAVVADYTLPLALPPEIGEGPRLGFFPGSTIGNFHREGVVAFLERVRATLAGGWLLIGHDPNGDPATLRRAYAEAEGLMAALHLNLLSHINRLIGANFDVENFCHDVAIERDPPRIEAYLTAKKPTTVAVEGRRLEIAEGERIHTDTSYKMDAASFLDLAEQAGWSNQRTWLDPEGLFALHLLRAD